MSAIVINFVDAKARVEQRQQVDRVCTCCGTTDRVAPQVAASEPVCDWCLMTTNAGVRADATLDLLT